LSILIVNQSANLQRSTGHKNSEEHKCHVSQSLFLKKWQDRLRRKRSGKCPKSDHFDQPSIEPVLFRNENDGFMAATGSEVMFRTLSNFRSRNRNTSWQVINQTTKNNFYQKT
jgi:hypothetical protein